MAIPGAQPSTALPRYCTLPLIGRARPAIKRKSVDLPDPDRPNRPGRGVNPNALTAADNQVGCARSKRRSVIGILCDIKPAAARSLCGEGSATDGAENA